MSPCDHIVSTGDVQGILEKFGKQALISAPAARIGKSAVVRSRYGGDDHLGLDCPKRPSKIDL